jgi:hypothetical protein
VIVLLLLALVVAAIYGAAHLWRWPVSTSGPGRTHASMRDDSRYRSANPVPLDDELARWTGAGLVTTAQADAIRAFEGQRRAPEQEPPGPRWGPVAEALGYLGGLLALIGLVVLVTSYWSDIPTAGRVGMTGAATLTLLVAGAAVDATAGRALARLRAFLGVLSSAAAAVFAGVVADDVLGRDRNVTIAAACAAAVVIHSGALWRWRDDRPVQQLVALGAAAIVPGTLTAHWASAGAAGIASWLAGATFLAAGLRHRTPNWLVTVLVGSTALAFAALVVAAEWPGTGSLFAATTALSLVAAALVPGTATTLGEQRVVGVVAAIAMVQTVPGSIAYYANDAGFATGAVVWLVGDGALLAGYRSWVRLPRLVEAAGAAAVLGGAATTAAQSTSVAPVLGIVSAVALLALGATPGLQLLSLFGSVGLLVNVPWAIARFFPGQGRAPLLIMVSGALIVVIAVMVARSGRLGHDGTR